MGGSLMSTRMTWQQQRVWAYYGRWAALIALPLVLNGIVWSLLVAPQHGMLQAWRDAQRLKDLKPSLDGMITQSREMVARYDRTGFTSDDPEAVMEALQRLADTHRVQMKSVSAQGSLAGEHGTKKSAVTGYSTMPVELALSGPFGKLAYWLGAVESQTGVHVEEWTLSNEADATRSQHLAVTLTAWLRET